MPRASSRSSSSAARSSSSAFAQQLCCTVRSAAELCASELEGKSEAEQPLLRAVVEVALETPSFLVAGLHDACPRSTQLGKLRTQLRLETFVLERQPRGSTGCFEQASALEEHRVVQQCGDRRVG
jgi:hypothetical protein